MTDNIDWGALHDAASHARSNAYAPYSNITVGSAVLADGRVFSGCNVENSSFPVGSCAERGALYTAVAAGCRDIQAVVIVSEEAIPPCGMCRQALAEFNPSVPIRLYGADSEILWNLDALLPEPFHLKCR
jgi:cytidine deaminase